MTTKQIDKIISKQCAVCGKDLEVIVYTDKSYTNGNYFCDIGKIEYWECDSCYKAG